MRNGSKPKSLQVGWETRVAIELGPLTSFFGFVLSSVAPFGEPIHRAGAALCSVGFLLIILTSGSARGLLYWSAAAVSVVGDCLILASRWG